MDSYQDIDLGLSTGAVELVTVQNVKDWAGIDTDLDDDLITGSIVAARRLIENFCGVTLVQQDRQLFISKPEEGEDNYFIPLPWPADPAETFTVATETATLTEDSDYELLGIYIDSIKLYAYYQNVTVTYTTKPITSPQLLEVAKNGIKYLVEKYYDNRATLEAGGEEMVLDSNLRKIIAPLRIPTL